MHYQRLAPVLLVVVSIGWLSGLAARTAREPLRPTLRRAEIESVSAVAGRVDRLLEDLWKSQDVSPAAPADELKVLKRLSLALHGTIPSLEEIRSFEADDRPHRLDRWTAAMLQDSRFVHYFGERLARAFIGVEDGQFVIFRRDRFTEWLRKQLRDQRPYDALVREVISASGVWTGKGEVNFITAAFANDEFDCNKLAARTVRTFLGQRMDCAQCHDHPFDVWTQEQFEGLTAHFAQVHLTLVGLQDQRGEQDDLPGHLAPGPGSSDLSEELQKKLRRLKLDLPKEPQVREVTPGAAWLIAPKDVDPTRVGGESLLLRLQSKTLTVASAEGEYFTENRETLHPRLVEPSVPFHPEWLGEGGSRRERLARWITHPQNRRFERAVANRVWGLMFGRPLLADRAVDDLPSPEDAEGEPLSEILDVLGRDFREHGCKLNRLIQVIAATRAFRCDSRASIDDAVISEMEQSWAVFPLVRLRPEQVIGAMLQANSLKTVDQNSHLFVRFLRLVREADFVREFGDPGENELSGRAGTIPQALLRMNGEFAHEMSAENPISAPARIARFSADDSSLVQNAFLACLTRRPTPDEEQYFVEQLQPGVEQPGGVVQDLFWTLYNSPEFSWNH
jgi:hypothetical protein